VIITEKILRETLLLEEHDTDAYLLYGSYARGDYESRSDVDILRITTGRMRAPRINGQVLLHIYDLKDLLNMARQGSLFILHLIREAKPIIDPMDYLRQISAAFRKPASYVSTAREMTAHASTLLDVDESLFATAPRRFMEVGLFLCRTLMYAEHADQGSFSFSLRSLATQDDVAFMLYRIKDVSLSYSDFRSLRQAVREKLISTESRIDVSSIAELTQKKQGDPLFDGLLRRIVKAESPDGYVLPADARSNRIVASQQR
jgi:predicted nucleotidyltransferase